MGGCWSRLRLVRECDDDDEHVVRSGDSCDVAFAGGVFYEEDGSGLDWSDFAVACFDDAVTR